MHVEQAQFARTLKSVRTGIRFFITSNILRRDAREGVERMPQERRAGLKLVATEYMNICAALRWSVDNDRSIGLQLALALPEFWERKGLYAEARRWLEALLDPIDATIEREDPIVAWRAVNALALSYYWTAEAKRACCIPPERALAMTRSYDDPSMTAKSLNNLGIALLETGEAEQARSVLEEALAIKEDREGAWSVASTVGNLGIALRMCREYKQALKCHERARELFRSIADAWGEARRAEFPGRRLLRLPSVSESRVLLHEEPGNKHRREFDH